MNKSEEKGYKWLLKKGYKEEEIAFQRKGIDFICADGKGYEVKKLYGHTIWFHKGQLERTKGENNSVLVFDEEEEPIAVISSMELEKDRVISGIKITVVNKEPNEGYSVISLKREVIEEIKQKAKESGLKSISAFLSRVLEEREVKKEDIVESKEDLKEVLETIRTAIREELKGEDTVKGKTKDLKPKDTVRNKSVSKEKIKEKELIEKKEVKEEEKKEQDKEVNDKYSRFKPFEPKPKEKVIPARPL